jgi:hypothetical protein
MTDKFMIGNQEVCSFSYWKDMDRYLFYNDKGWLIAEIQNEIDDWNEEDSIEVKWEKLKEVFGEWVGAE